MQGFCVNCGRMVEMMDVVTVRLSNHSFIHRGSCSEKGCGGIVWVKIYDQDILIDEVGHKFPKEIFVDEQTPKRFLNEHVGQKLIFKDKVVETTSKTGKILTVFDLKEEKGKDDEESK